MGKRRVERVGVAALNEWFSLFLLSVGRVNARSLILDYSWSKEDVSMNFRIKLRLILR